MIFKIYTNSNEKGIFKFVDLIFSKNELKETPSQKAYRANINLDKFANDVKTADNFNLLLKPLLIDKVVTNPQVIELDGDLFKIDMQNLIIKSNPDKKELIKWLNNLIVFVKAYEQIIKPVEPPKEEEDDWLTFESK